MNILKGLNDYVQDLDAIPDQDTVIYSDASLSEIDSILKDVNIDNAIQYNKQFGYYGLASIGLYNGTYYLMGDLIK